MPLPFCGPLLGEKGAILKVSVLHTPHVIEDVLSLS